jgi:hypothetical protein
MRPELDLPWGVLALVIAVFVTQESEYRNEEYCA